MPLVWVLDPEARRTTVHRLLIEVEALGEADGLAGEDVLPGFQAALSDIFPAS